MSRSANWVTFTDDSNCRFTVREEAIFAFGENMTGGSNICLAYDGHAEEITIKESFKEVLALMKNTGEKTNG